MENKAEETKDSTREEEQAGYCGCTLIALFFLFPSISGSMDMADAFITFFILFAVGIAFCYVKKPFLKGLILLLSAAAALYFWGEAWALPLLFLTTAMSPIIALSSNNVLGFSTFGLMMGIALWFVDEALWTIPFFILPAALFALISSRIAFWNLLSLCLTLAVSAILWHMHDTRRAILFFCWAGMEFLFFTPLMKWAGKIYYFPGFLSFAAAGYLWATDEIGRASVLFVLAGLLAMMGRTYQHRKKLREEEQKQAQLPRSVQATSPEELSSTFIFTLTICLLMGWSLYFINSTSPLSISSILFFLFICLLAAFFSSENIYLNIWLLVIAISASGIFHYTHDNTRAGFLFVWALIELGCIKPAIINYKKQKRIKERNKAIAELIAMLQVHAENRQSEAHGKAE
ncbi:MAG: hypothetical protein K2O17_01725 [Bacteroidaceae bacterium]|nr:hypothetical protein [Bacteroidaceae bacterium]